MSGVFVFSAIATILNICPGTDCLAQKKSNYNNWMLGVCIMLGKGARNSDSQASLTSRGCRGDSC